MNNICIRSLICCLMFLTPVNLEATAQSHEILRIQGVEVSIISNPLQPWIAMNPDSIPDFDIISTGRWRGYLGSWELRSEHLYLVDLFVLKRVEGAETFEAENISVMATVFPPGEPVFADWYSGYLIVTKGKLKKYVHMGYASKYAAYLVIAVESGRVVEETTMTSKKFERFRRAQFRSYQQTEHYREFLESTVDEDTTEEKAIEFIYESASVYYLSKKFQNSERPE